MTSKNCLIQPILLALGLLGLPLAASAQMAVEYYHLDAIGNVLVVTDNAGAVVEQHDYDVFGQECNAQAGSQPKRFTGKERDQETGWDYFGARYYGSKVGRFTTVDPVYNWSENLVDPQRWNRYAYGRNNPLRYVDPDGRDIFEYFGGVINAFGSNLVLGGGRASGGSSDFQFGQTVGDSLSLVAAGFEAKVGGALAVGGGVATATVAGAEVGVPALAAGAALVAHGAGMGATALTHLSKNNASTSSEKPRQGKERTLDGAQDQLESIEHQQAAQRRAGRDTINSTKKSEQNLKTEIKRIKSTEDLKSQE